MQQVYIRFSWHETVLADLYTDIGVPDIGVGADLALGGRSIPDVSFLAMIEGNLHSHFLGH